MTSTLTMDVMFVAILSFVFIVQSRPEALDAGDQKTKASGHTAYFVEKGSSGKSKKILLTQSGMST
jgi:hypothetical protein